MHCCALCTNFPNSKNLILNYNVSITHYVKKSKEQDARQGDSMFKAVLSSAIILGAASTAFAASEKRKNHVDHVPGELIVKLKKSSKSFTDFGSAKYLSNNTYLVKPKTKNNLEAVLLELNGREEVEYAEYNYIYHKTGWKSSVNANDPAFDKLWGLKNTGDNEPKSSGRNSSPSGISGADINAEKAWGITKGDRRIKIAVIDTGVDYNHEDLKANMWVNTAEANGKPGVDDDGNGYIDDIHGYDFAGKDGDPMDGNGHGTHCAGTIAGVHNNGIGVTGVMGDAQIVAVKFLDDNGSGNTADAIMAINYATKVGVDIMSNSWGGGGRSQALEDAIKEARDAGIIFTAAAGNSATNNDSAAQYPANYDLENVISVAAHNYNDKLATFSCYGANTVHVAGPGRNIYSTIPGNKYDVYSGTSMATPHITGVVGLYLAKYGKQDPASLRDRLMKTSVYSKNFGRRLIGGGRVDAYNFLAGIVTARPPKPSENAWIHEPVELFETQHPYAANSDIVKTYTIAGAKFMRVVVRKYGIEKTYDALKILDKDGVEVETIDGTGIDYKSEYVEGDTISINFKSDTSVQDYGVEIDEIQYIK